MFSTSFNHAIGFTLGRNMQLDTERDLLSQPYQPEAISNLTKELAGALQEQLDASKRHGYDPMVRFGGDCGNVHFLALSFIQKYYPDLPANLTIGEIRFNREAKFSFSEDKFLRWQKARPNLLDCHVWVTVGCDTIVDLTVGTYINDRILKSTKFGGIFHGSPGQLIWNPIVGVENQMPDTSSLEYLPVVLGRKAFLSIVPKA